MRASSEQTLRSQAELAQAALQQRVAALEAECAGLRAANQELFQAKSDAEEQRDSVAGCACSWAWHVCLSGTCAGGTAFCCFTCCSCILAQLCVLVSSTNLLLQSRGRAGCAPGSA